MHWHWCVTECKGVGTVEYLGTVTDIVCDEYGVGVGAV